MKALSVMLLSIPLTLERAYAEDSVILGRASSHKSIEDVEIECPPEYICMNVWFRWTLTVSNCRKATGMVSSESRVCCPCGCGVQLTKGQATELANFLSQAAR
jgi:hypothetical protein